MAKEIRHRGASEDQLKILHFHYPPLTGTQVRVAPNPGCSHGWHFTLL